MNLITETHRIEKKYCKERSRRLVVADPDKWVRDLLVSERLHNELMTTTDPQHYKQIEQQIQSMVDTDGDHD